MKKTIIAAAAAALLASVTFGLAAPNFRGDGPRPTPAQMAENAGAMSDARIAALKAGLRMTPDQEKLWPGVEAALRELSQERIDRRTERFEQKAEKKADDERPNPIERMRERADAMIERGDTLKKLVAAADPLYQSLDDSQKHRFNRLFRDAQGERMASRHGWERHGWGRHGDRDGHGPHRGGPDGFGPRGPMPHGPGEDGPEPL